MLELRTPQRVMLVDKLPDAANLGVGAMFFGQFLSERAFSVRVALFGIGLWIVLTGCALMLAGKEQS